MPSLGQPHEVYLLHSAKGKSGGPKATVILLTISFASSVASLGGSSIMTERVI